MSAMASLAADLDRAETERPTFADAMNLACPACYLPAREHRLTASGSLYCLTPARGYDAEYWLRTRPAYNYVRPVRELVRSPLPASVGSVIRESLGTYL